MTQLSTQLLATPVSYVDNNNLRSAHHYANKRIMFCLDSSPMHIGRKITFTEHN